MLKERTTIEIAINILRILSIQAGPVLSSEISNQIGSSSSYTAKVLSRMTNINLLSSSIDGYILTKPYDLLVLADVLKICHQDPDDKLWPIVLNKTSNTYLKDINI